MNTPQLIITIIKWILIAFICVEAYTTVSVLFSRRNKFAVMARNSIDLALGKTDSVYFNPDRITANLSKYGVMYHLRDYNMEPSTFIAFKILSSGICALLLFLVTPEHLITKLAAVILGIVLGFFVPDLLIRIQNQSDNDEMMDDIQTIYMTLKNHAKAEVHITDSLIECQRSISNGRLKEALNEMNNNILSHRSELVEAIDQFNARFCNEQIDNLCVALKQRRSTGYSVDMLSDISKQIETNDRIQSMKTRDRIKRQAAFIQVGYFMMITFMLLYLVAMELIVGVSGI